MCMGVYLAQMQAWAVGQLPPKIYFFFQKHVCAIKHTTYLIQKPALLPLIIPEVAITMLSQAVSLFMMLLEI